jgi:hypothetical protein
MSTCHVHMCTIFPCVCADKEKLHSRQLSLHNPGARLNVSPLGLSPSNPVTYHCSLAACWKGPQQAASRHPNPGVARRRALSFSSLDRSFAGRCPFNYIEPFVGFPWYEVFHLRWIRRLSGPVTTGSAETFPIVADHSRNSREK